MAKSEATINAEEFIKKVDKSKEQYHLNNMRAIAQTLDIIRKDAADDFIIPRKGPYPFNKYTYNQLQRIQPTHSKKLTERTGLLTSILKSKGTWTEKLKKFKLKANKHLMFWVMPQSTGKSFTYLAKLSIVPKGDDRIKYRVAHEKGRFKSRKARPFIAPAYKANKKTVEKKIKANLRLSKKI